MTQFKNEFSNLAVMESTTFNRAAKQLNNEMLKTIEKIVAATTKTITSRNKKPCYDEDLKNKERSLKTEEINGSNTEKIKLESIQKGMK